MLFRFTERKDEKYINSERQLNGTVGNFEVAALPGAPDE